MSWLALITGAIKLISSLADYLRDKKLMDAGAAEAVMKGQADVLESLRRIQVARDAVVTDSDPDWSKRVRDKYTRK
jgi:hypothetical protein